MRQTVFLFQFHSIIQSFTSHQTTRQSESRILAMTVHWALPREKSRSKYGNKDEARRYAMTLFQRPIEELHNMEKEHSIPYAHLKSPIAKQKDLDGGNSGVGQPLQTLWNEIRQQYTNRKFLTVFSRDDSAAVVAAGAEDDQIHLLDGSYRLDVTVGEHQASLNFLRHTRPGVGQCDVFIELPSGTSVRINGRNFTNNSCPTEEAFYLGPLRMPENDKSFFIVEVLSQPFFFYRTAEDTKYNTKATKPDVDALPEKINGDVQLQWTKLDDIEEADIDASYSNDTDSVMASEVAGSYLVPIRHHTTNSCILLIFQLQPNDRVSIHVMAAKAWAISASDRAGIFADALEHLLAGDLAWWDDQSEDCKANPPEVAYWVDCAQHHDPVMIESFTMLNAWALALGLKPRADFSPAGMLYKDNNFSIVANYLVDMACRDGAYRQHLLAFCSGMTGFAKPSTFQTTADNVISHRYERTGAKTGEDHLSIDVCLGLDFDRPHTAVFPCDMWTTDFRMHLAPTIVQNGLMQLFASQEELENLWADSNWQLPSGCSSLTDEDDELVDELGREAAYVTRRKVSVLGSSIDQVDGDKMTSVDAYIAGNNVATAMDKVL
ncbi:hypothetical protein ACN47E_009987 [Coniothyrium glycines]